MAKGKRNEPTVEPTGSDIAYLAGFIDGEGCITVRISPGTKHHKTWNPSVYASVTISQVDPRTLQWIQARWGGSIRKLSRNRGNERTAWEWCVVGHYAQRLFEQVRPMLKSKGEQADNAMRLATLRKARGWGNGLTPHEVEVQADIRSTALALNLRAGGQEWKELP